MAINVNYGPIAQGLELAQQSGKGQDYWRRFAAGQQQLDRLDRQTAQAMQSRSQQIQEGLARERMKQQERQAQSTLGIRQAEAAALEKYRIGQATRAEQAEGRAQTREGRQQKQFEFSKEQAMAASELQADKEQRMVKAQETREKRFYETTAGKKLKSDTDVASDREKRAKKRVDDSLDDFGYAKNEKEAADAQIAWSAATKHLQAAEQRRIDGVYQNTAQLPQVDVDTDAVLQNQQMSPEQRSESNIQNAVQWWIQTIGSNPAYKGKPKSMIIREVVASLEGKFSPEESKMIVQEIVKGI